jgi:hypothetical protein
MVWLLDAERYGHRPIDLDASRTRRRYKSDSHTTAATRANDDSFHTLQAAAKDTNAPPHRETCSCVIH